MYESEFTPDDTLGLGIFVGALIVGLVIFLLIRIFFLLTCKKALTQCSEENRTMSPGLIWLALIPGFNLIWDFFVVINLGDSLDKEFKKRGIITEAFPGKSIGLAFCITDVCGLVPIVNFLAGPASFVCWIIYWIKIAGFSKQLAASPSSAAAAGPQQTIGSVGAPSVTPTVAAPQPEPSPVSAPATPEQAPSLDSAPEA
jgi:hypothetical protein